MSQNGNNSCSFDDNMQQMKFTLKESVQVCKILIHTDKRFIKNDVIFTMIDINGQRQPFLSPISGTVTQLYIHEWDILSYDSIILEYEECRHTVTFENLCADCGIELNQRKNALAVSNSLKETIRMEPSFPQVTITREAALRYDDEERNHLLRKRKLHLLVDLDQTLVHTTNTRDHYPFSSEVIAYQLNSSTFYTKVRPGVKEFLTNHRSLYQFHIVTFGDRPYANTIAKIIDPNGTFFSHRILSRDECLSLTDKTANLSSLFPCGDSLVCIIDDREDVWNSAPNLVQVKPYTWFNDVGDINGIYLPPLTQIKEGKHQQGEKRKFDTENDQMDEKPNEDNNFNIVADSDLYLHQLEIVLKRIHTGFYKTYDQWIQNKYELMPDLKQIIPNIRRQVLGSVSLCFSHLMPQNYPIEKHRATILAKAMGAKVTSDLQFDRNGTIQTTHVIAGNQTVKVNQALQNKIKVVTPEWLIDCYEDWEKKPEENYMLTSDYNVRKSKLFTEEIPRVPKRSYCDIQQQVPVANQERNYSQKNNGNRLNKIVLEDDQYDLNMNVDERFDVERKMNEFGIEDTDDGSDVLPSKRQCTAPTAEIVNDNDSDSDSSSIYKLHDLILGKKDGYSSDEESLDDDEVPRGWKKVLRRKGQHS